MEPCTLPQPCQGAVPPCHGSSLAQGRVHCRSGNSMAWAQAPHPLLCFQLLPLCCSLDALFLFPPAYSRSPAFRASIWAPAPSSPLPLQGGLESMESSVSALGTGRTRSRLPQRVGLSAAGGTVLDRSVGRRVWAVPRICSSDHTAQKCAWVPGRWKGLLLPCGLLHGQHDVHSAGGGRWGRSPRVPGTLRMNVLIFISFLLVRMCTQFPRPTVTHILYFIFKFSDYHSRLLAGVLFPNRTLCPICARRYLKHFPVPAKLKDLQVFPPVHPCGVPPNFCRVWTVS